MRRHPILAQRESEEVTQASATVSPGRIKIWFDSVEKLLAEEGNLDILKDPTRVFNGDETNFLLWPKNTKVLAEKGAKNVYEVDGGAAKSALTVMFSFSASGSCVPPMIIYPYVRIPDEIMRGVPLGWGVGSSESGWMTSENFYEYIANIFNRFLEEENIERPVILFVDGHKSHLNYQISHLCSYLQIALVALYPNATRILQPADVACFKPMKDGWKKAVLEWRHRNPFAQITRKDVAPLLKGVIDKTMNKQLLENGFRASGLFPWDYTNLDFSKMIVGWKVVNDLSTNCFENTSCTSLKVFNALKKVISFSPPNLESSNIPGTPQSPSAPAIMVDSVAERVNGVCSVAEDVPGPSGTNAKVDPIVIKKMKYGPLEDWLVWPKTPEKKGQRSRKQMPYVITSTAWRAEKEEEMAKKEEQAKVKEERANKRKEKALLNPKIPVKKKKVGKIKTVSAPVQRPKKTSTRKMTHEILDSSSSVDEDEVLPPSKMITRRTIFSDSEDDDDAFPDLSHQESASDAAVKVVAMISNDDKNGEEIILASEEEVTVENKGPALIIDEMLDDGAANCDGEFIIGMCFVCTKSLNAKKPGRSCDICDRLFHISCDEVIALKGVGGISACRMCNDLSEDLASHLPEE